LVDIANRSGRCTVWTGAVFDGDEFDYALGDRPFVMHKPGEEDDPSKLVYVYAVGRVNGSEWPVIEVWSMKKVWRHRDQYNKVGQRHYSFRDKEMYARKVPLLQVLKYMPSSIELSNAIGRRERCGARPERHGRHRQGFVNVSVARRRARRRARRNSQGRRRQSSGQAGAVGCGAGEEKGLARQGDQGRPKRERRRHRAGNEEHPHADQKMEVASWVESPMARKEPRNEHARPHPPPRLARMAGRARHAATTPAMRPPCSGATPSLAHGPARRHRQGHRPKWAPSSKSSSTRATLSRP
jgi:hypothetical protein